MIYLSTEHKILRLLWKIHQNKIAARERLMTDGSLDIEKIKELLLQKGIKPMDARDAFQSLVLAGFSNSNGQITQAGALKLKGIEDGRRADLEASSLSTLIVTGFGDPDKAVVDSLEAKEY